MSHLAAASLLLVYWPFQTTVTTFHLFQGILQNKGEVGGAMSVACRVI